jgi:hypothetical protein
MFFHSNLVGMDGKKIQRNLQKVAACPHTICKHGWRFCLGCVDQTIRGDDGKLVTAQPRARPMLNLAISRNRQGQNCIQMSRHLRPQSWRNGGT